MNHERLHGRLAEVETLLADMADLLVRGDAPAHETAATALRQAMVELAHASHRTDASPLHADLRERLQQVAHTLARQRENLARRSVITTRALAAVLPQHSATYTAPGRSGPFRSAIARIYPS